MDTSLSESDYSLTDGDVDLDVTEDVEKDDDDQVAEEKESCALQASNKPVRKMFSDEQVACLCDHHKRGMIGVGRKYNYLIQSASEETGLKLTQVKVS